MPSRRSRSFAAHPIASHRVPEALYACVFVTFPRSALNRSTPCALVRNAALWCLMISHVNSLGISIAHFIVGRVVECRSTRSSRDARRARTSAHGAKSHRSRVVFGTKIHSFHHCFGVRCTVFTFPLFARTRTPDARRRRARRHNAMSNAALRALRTRFASYDVEQKSIVGAIDRALMRGGDDDDDDDDEGDEMSHADGRDDDDDDDDESGRIKRRKGKTNRREAKALIGTLRALEGERAMEVFARSLAEASAGGETASAPARAERRAAPGSEEYARWRVRGLEIVKAKTLAVVLLAGGQGTRLGSANPKGMYDIGLPSGKSLFALQGERLKKLGDLAGGCAPVWYVMTSPFTHDMTVNYFKQHEYFGLRANDVIFFKQGTLPCFTESGEIIMKSYVEVSEAPDGNGGIYAALAREGIIDDMRRRGIEHVYAYCVDNALVQVGDPAFVGCCAECRCEAGAKVIAKAYPTEPVGVFATRVNEKTGEKEYHVVEYSEIPESLASARDEETGELKFNAANIALHYYSFDFLAKCCLDLTLPHHIARKKIPYLDVKTGETVNPEQPNGIKLEAFIFDVYKYAKSVCIVQGDRALDFAPVKNAEGAGKDSPDTARALITALHAKWIIDAGGSIEGVPEGAAPACEIAPHVSYAGENIPKNARVAHRSHVCRF